MDSNTFSTKELSLLFSYCFLVHAAIKWIIKILRLLVKVSKILYLFCYLNRTGQICLVTPTTAENKVRSNDFKITN